MNELNNKQLLELIKTDVEGFNAYRKEYPNQEIDFSGANLYKANLVDANLEGANLYKANLRWAYLYDANLTGANLVDANLTDANLTVANLSGINLTVANFSGAKLENVTITLTKDNLEAIKGCRL